MLESVGENRLMLESVGENRLMLESVGVNKTDVGIIWREQD